jgi:hypothetical protein
MADVLTYVVSAASPVDGDVVSRVLTVSVNGVEQGSATFAGSAIDLGTVTVPQDADVKLTLVDIDDAGNLSLPAEYYFVAVDTVAPAIPGGFGVTLVGETTVPEPGVSSEPAVEPESAVEPAPEARDEV